MIEWVIIVAALALAGFIGYKLGVAVTEKLHESGEPCESTSEEAKALAGLKWKFGDAKEHEEGPELRPNVWLFSLADIPDSELDGSLYSDPYATLSIVSGDDGRIGLYGDMTNARFLRLFHRELKELDVSDAAALLTAINANCWHEDDIHTLRSVELLLRQHVHSSKWWSDVIGVSALPERELYWPKESDDDCDAGEIDYVGSEELGTV